MSLGQNVIKAGRRREWADEFAESTAGALGVGDVVHLGLSGV